MSPSLDTLCGALSAILGIPAPAQAAPAEPGLVRHATEAFSGRPADRLFLYNPDAIARWIEEKHPDFLTEVRAAAPFAQPFETVMPSVTPVCFGTMYTGVQPEVHGIRKYEKPVIRTDSFFDALLRAGKRVAIVAETNCSMALIFREREMDYFIFDTIDEVNAKTAELILRDEYDVLCVYNGDYDETMHRWGPEHPLSLGALRANVHAFGLFAALIRSHWTNHDTLLGFAMDHGCHEIDGGCGSHGLDMPEDLEIVHHYGCLPKRLGI